MHKRILLLLSLLALCMGLFCACGHSVEPITTDTTADTPSIPVFDISEVEFTAASITFSEAEHSLGSYYSTRKNMDVAERNGITYAFEPSISLEIRAQCIQATEAILKKIGTAAPVRIHIYSPKSYNSTFIKDGSVYTCVQNWSAPEYAVSLLYGLFGEYCNYGAIYGYSNYLCNTVETVEQWNYTGQTDVLDLTLPCFRPEFVDEQSISAIEQISNTFVVNYIENQGITAFHKLLQASGDPQNITIFTQALAQFYAANGISYTPTHILYRPGGIGYDYIAKNEYAVMYIEPDWQDRNMDLCPYTYDGFLHKNYTDTKQFFEINTEQMEKYQLLFALPSAEKELAIYFSNSASRNSAYNPAIHAICVRNTASLTHEYIHSLTIAHSMQEPWAIEGFARYFSYKYDYYGNAMSNVDYNSAPNEARYHYIHKFKAHLGRDIDVWTDYAQLLHIASYVYGYDDPNDADGYTSGASFIGYLISIFGEEKVIEIVCVTHDFLEFTLQELVADWQVFLQQNYRDYKE